MPLDRFVFIVVAVLCAAGLTVAIGAWLSASIALPGLGLALLLPIGLIAYVVVRVIRDRLDEHRREGNRYEGH